jgi:hypothetical protein
LLAVGARCRQPRYAAWIRLHRHDGSRCPLVETSLPAPRPSGSRRYGHLPDAGQQRALIAVKAQLEHSLPHPTTARGQETPMRMHH